MNVFPITPTSITCILAYIHHFQPPYLSGRLMSPKDLRHLAEWIGFPMPKMLTVRQNRMLAIHLALSMAADLIKITSGDYWQCTPETFQWLEIDQETQIRHLLDALNGKGTFVEVCHRLQLGEILTIDFTAYITQTLQRQGNSLIETDGEWTRIGIADGAIKLTVPMALKPSLFFHLLQLGEWTAATEIILNPTGLGEAAQRGYPTPIVQALLEKATGSRLPEEVHILLNQWASRNGSYRLETLHLLSTTQPEYLSEIIANRRLARYVLRQIGPRHVVVSAAIQKPLQRWLDKKGVGLDGNVIAFGPYVEPDYWEALALMVLADLANLIPLPVTLPAGRSAQLRAQLPTTVQTAVTAWAAEIVDNLRQIIRGQDAFFLPDQPIPEQWLIQLQAAIRADTVLAITYQSPADAEPRYRQIQPFRLEQRGDLWYLQAYCFRAETNLVFRVDRIKSIAE